LRDEPGQVTEKPISQQQMKQANLSRLFSDLRSLGRLSRAELAVRNQLSPTTVSHLIAELLARQLVRETDKTANGFVGRNPILLEINPAGGLLLVVEMHRNGFRLVGYDLALNRLAAAFFELTAFSPLADLVADRIDAFTAAHSMLSAPLLGVVFAIPALIDQKDSRVIYSTVIQFDPADHFVQHLAQRLSVPVRLGNESAFWCYAESDQSGHADCVFIDVGEGIGCDMMIHGQLFQGANGLQGEIGHMTVDCRGPVCACHNRGCLELFASLPALARRSAAKARTEPDSRLFRQSGQAEISLADLVSAWTAGDDLAAALIEEEALYLAAGINNVINLFDPAEVVLGGGIRAAGENFMALVNRCLNEIRQNRQATVRLSERDDNAMARGAARWLLDDLVDRQALFHA
jgi:predicted NBD/HSP70 family sugar kinase